MTRVLVLNGPNLNRLGKRQPEIYGSTTLADIEAGLSEHAARLGVGIDFLQSNHEGELIDRIHQAADAGESVIINPGGFTHTSVALRDALAEIADGPGFVEVHISNVHAREDFRHHSYLSPVARGVIAGLGVHGYHAALEYLAA
ncbi:MAG: type II 3-dehydroquinate dehydratase [Corynebacterium sp.]|uniref:type II 3-dehydroquinate dehydratase n=1 Tax=Corynebacterium TaxID=1716 RepID=UPI0026472BA8|nr:type II 3-dehydroquinate dehydratase [Corynebacterium sp.]MDN5722291.1 type II 3-dehydroquinate dehydratase [Corynebacterium sp.]MDN6282443.1 type II 3-dehydroquinate dehydratase [Corynebacterium sp.]MDN6306333.1 type II 3-dehydroquinate dehydratase [Corynebacterium sp.]MDN6351945.1 type II 3-dehydroquinate dehydratase [Corynebacterium sp.]MDN6366606.1 type II 3-dehydroquinate dehydratase [Corynebacterium sp.]